MKPKLHGCCSKCDAEVFEIIERDPETRAPTRVGAPLDEAERATFLLMNGSRMDLTLCAGCAAGLQPADYAFLWQRVMVSWIAQSGPDHPWPKSQIDNGICAVLHRQPWKEVR